MQNTLAKVSVRKGREWQLKQGHPWLFSGAISQAPKVDAGSLVDIVDTDGCFVARGYYNPCCDIAVRVLTRSAEQIIDTNFFRERITEAYALRELAIDLATTNVYRLINAEADFLPGYIVDYYAGVLVVQSHTAGADKLLPAFLTALQEVVKARCTIVRNDSGVRKREGLELEPPHVVAGELPEPIVVQENSLKFQVDPVHGQKTGFFTDQRDKRQAVRRYCERSEAGAKVLNCFSYTGSFSVYACEGNRSITTVNVDQSHRALDEAKKNFELNNIPTEAHEFICADAFEWLTTCVAGDERFDLTIVDPPAFAKSHKDKPRALKAYKRMDKLGIQATKTGGIMVTCSCSGSISFNEFLECLKEAAGESGRRVQVLDCFQNGADHPVNAVAAETGYLKVVFCRVLD